ncbi:transglutaminase domain-containing protein [Kitasatospora camelliae]|uniref:Transglutaminase domain-containing protein n=1 Tax=Kitasatospora camelliae TaxID=3156397 RepID=A0AAU8K7J5_9ACTN
MSSLLRPNLRPRRAVAVAQSEVAGGTEPTRILDWTHPRVAALTAELAVGAASSDPHGAPAAPLDAPARIALLRRAHRLIAVSVQPVYSVEDERRVSRVLARGRGSCSQRLALLEAVARSAGVPTRVRGLLVDGRFWHPRFPRLRRIVPDQVLLAWPEFRLQDGPEAVWLPVSELFGSIESLRAADGRAFTNDGPETLFEALARTAVDWDGGGAGLCPAAAPDSCDLSAHVLRDLGRYDARDDLFARHGQTLCRPARLLAEPVLGRRPAGL